MFIEIALNVKFHHKISWSLPGLVDDDFDIKLSVDKIWQVVKSLENLNSDWQQTLIEIAIQSQLMG